MSSENGKGLSFIEVLQGHRRGALLALCAAELDKLVEEMAASNEGGSMTLKMGFKFDKHGQLEMTPVVNVTPPKKTVSAGIFYVTKDNRLTRTDPNQMTLDDELERRRADVHG